MKKIIKNIMIIFLTVIFLIVIGFSVLLLIMNYKNKNYWKYSDAKGKIEAKYTALGPCEVSFLEAEDEGTAWGKYEVWYPSKIQAADSVYPLVVMANGTGVKASKYKEVFEHLASWGFIVVGNEDDSSRSGESSAASLDFVLSLNEDKNSDLFGKVDVKNVGIAGHSQGAVGAINAVTGQKNGPYYKAVFAASTTSSVLTKVLGDEWEYDLSKLNIPCFLVAGTGNADAGTAGGRTAGEGQGICPLWSLNENFEAISDTTDKVMARRVGKDHGDMLRYADGYMTAWFMYYLRGDTEAGQAFFGENAEILFNENWQDIKINCKD